MVIDGRLVVKNRNLKVRKMICFQKSVKNEIFGGKRGKFKGNFRGKWNLR